jgi:8-oxo-dGTP diphosphatase
MKKGIDFIGITVSFYCHDGKGNYVMHKRGPNCRDEHGCWDFGGGGVEFGETLEQALVREIGEEYGVVPIEYQYLGHDEKFREHNGVPTHWLGFRYIALVDREKVINNEPDKHEELHWVKLDDLPSPLHSLVPRDMEKYTPYLS